MYHVYHLHREIMISTCTDLDSFSELFPEHQHSKKILCQSESEAIVLDTQEKNASSHQNGKRYLGLKLSSLYKLMPMFQFFGMMESANGVLDYDDDIVLSSSWLTMKSNLCVLVYIKECFDKAISNGKLVPSININATLNNVLRKVNSTFPIKIADHELDHRFYYVSDYLGAVSRRLILNKTDYLLELLDRVSLEQFDDIPLANLTVPAIGDIRNDEYNNDAIISNVGRKTITKIINIKSQSIVKENSIYCRSIVKYIDTSFDSNDILVELSTVEPTTTELATVESTTAAILFSFMSFLFLFIAIFALAKNRHRCFNFRRINNYSLTRNRNSLPENANNINMLMLSDITEEEVTEV